MPPKRSKKKATPLTDDIVTGAPPTGAKPTPSKRRRGTKRSEYPLPGNGRNPEDSDSQDVSLAKRVRLDDHASQSQSDSAALASHTPLRITVGDPKGRPGYVPAFIDDGQPGSSNGNGQDPFGNWQPMSQALFQSVVDKAINPGHVAQMLKDAKRVKIYEADGIRDAARRMMQDILTKDPELKMMRSIDGRPSVYETFMKTGQYTPPDFVIEATGATPAVAPAQPFGSHPGQSRQQTQLSQTQLWDNNIQSLSSPSSATLSLTPADSTFPHNPAASLFPFTQESFPNNAMPPPRRTDSNASTDHNADTPHSDGPRHFSMSDPLANSAQGAAASQHGGHNTSQNHVRAPSAVPHVQSGAVPGAVTGAPPGQLDLMRMSDEEFLRGVAATQNSGTPMASNMQAALNNMSAYGAAYNGNRAQTPSNVPQFANLPANAFPQTGQLHGSVSGVPYNQVQAGQRYNQAQAGQQYNQAQAGQQYNQAQAIQYYHQAQAGQHYHQAHAGLQYRQGQAGPQYNQAQPGQQYNPTQPGQQYGFAQPGQQHASAMMPPPNSSPRAGQSAGAGPPPIQVQSWAQAQVPPQQGMNNGQPAAPQGQGQGGLIHLNFQVPGEPLTHGVRLLPQFARWLLTCDLEALPIERGQFRLPLGGIWPIPYLHAVQQLLRRNLARNQAIQNLQRQNAGLSAQNGFAQAQTGVTSQQAQQAHAQEMQRRYEMLRAGHAPGQGLSAGGAAAQGQGSPAAARAQRQGSVIGSVIPSPGSAMRAGVLGQGPVMRQRFNGDMMLESSIPAHIQTADQIGMFINRAWENLQMVSDHYGGHNPSWLPPWEEDDAQRQRRENFAQQLAQRRAEKQRRDDAAASGGEQPGGGQPDGESSAAGQSAAGQSSGDQPEGGQPDEMEL